MLSNKKMLLFSTYLAIQCLRLSTSMEVKGVRDAAGLAPPPSFQTEADAKAIGANAKAGVKGPAPMDTKHCQEKPHSSKGDKINDPEIIVPTKQKFTSIGEAEDLTKAVETKGAFASPQLKDATALPDTPPRVEWLHATHFIAEDQLPAHATRSWKDLTKGNKYYRPLWDLRLDDEV